jgi:hypothetical protein
VPTNQLTAKLPAVSWEVRCIVRFRYHRVRRGPRHRAGGWRQICDANGIGAVSCFCELLGDMAPGAALPDLGEETLVYEVADVGQCLKRQVICNDHLAISATNPGKPRCGGRAVGIPKLISAHIGKSSCAKGDIAMKKGVM